MAYTHDQLIVIANTLKFTRDSAVIRPEIASYVEKFDNDIIPNLVAQLQANGCDFDVDMFCIACGVPPYAIGTVH